MKEQEYSIHPRYAVIYPEEVFITQVFGPGHLSASSEYFDDVLEEREEVMKAKYQRWLECRDDPDQIPF